MEELHQEFLQASMPPPLIKKIPHVYTLSLKQIEQAI